MATAEATQEKTGLGNYFVANYPPFSFWKPAHLPEACQALASSPKPETPLGLYLHIPFCRKRCKFCYFRVYTDKNARDVEVYLEALENDRKNVESYQSQINDAQTALVRARTAAASSQNSAAKTQENAKAY